MPSSQISYARKPCNVQALDQIMLTIVLILDFFNLTLFKDAELKEFHSDKYFFRIKQAIFERWSTKLNVDNRRLKYWFKGFQKNFSTKKCSGPKKSNYECFDSEIYARLPNFALNEKIDRIMIRWVAMSVIQIHDLSFKCSDSYLTRLILRLQIIAVKEVFFFFFFN